MKDHHTSVTSLNWTTIRRWKRYRVDIRLKITYWKDSAKKIVFGQSSDVSEGGMAAYVPVEMQPGNNIDIEAILPYTATKKPVIIKAIIRNRNGFRYGLEYVLITETVRETLPRLLKALELVED